MDVSGTEPAVTIVIPALNEERHIERCLESVVAQGYPSDLIEVLVLDGGSTDRTVDLATRFAERLPALRIVDNPQRIQAAALNIALAEASNDVIVRLDAHTDYATDYVERSVAALMATGAAVVGGPMRPRGDTPFGEAVAEATTSLVGVGPGKFHYEDAAGPVDTVYLGTFLRQTVQSVGGYDERFAIGEDHELNFRITQAGGTIVLDPSIRSWYTPRGSPWALWTQYLRYGRAKVATLRKHGRFPTLRPLAPAALVAYGALSAVALLTSLRTVVWIPWAVYAGVVLLASVRRSPRRFPSIALAIVIMHFAYGLGLWTAIVRTRKTKV